MPEPILSELCRTVNNLTATEQVLNQEKNYDFKIAEKLRGDFPCPSSFCPPAISRGFKTEAASVPREAPYSLDQEGTERTRFANYCVCL